MAKVTPISSLRSSKKAIVDQAKSSDLSPLEFLMNIVQDKEFTEHCTILDQHGQVKSTYERVRHPSFMERVDAAKVLLPYCSPKLAPKFEDSDPNKTPEAQADRIRAFLLGVRMTTNPDETND